MDARAIVPGMCVMGIARKRSLGEQGHIELAMPRDRQGSGLPATGQERTNALEISFDEKILALYARGMTTRDIQAQLQERDASGSLANTHLECDRGGDGRGTPVADASARAGLPHCLCRLTGASVCVRTNASSTKRSTWSWQSIWRATRNCWGCGSRHPRGSPRSGSRCSPSCRTAA